MLFGQHSVCLLLIYLQWKKNHKDYLSKLLTQVLLSEIFLGRKKHEKG